MSDSIGTYYRSEDESKLFLYGIGLLMRFALVVNTGSVYLFSKRDFFFNGMKLNHKEDILWVVSTPHGI